MSAVHPIENHDKPVMNVVLSDADAARIGRIGRRVVRGDNSMLIAEVARTRGCLPNRAVVLDVTWGRGVFWRRFTEHRRFTLIGSDLRPLPGVNLVADFRRLPCADASIDIVVFDPPYVHVGRGGHYLDSRYGGTATTTGFTHRDIMKLYGDGLREAMRVLRPNGQVWVKCADEIESGRQCWTSCELFEIAEALGFEVQDMWMLVRKTINPGRWRRQLHARKVNSWLWIFRKPL